MSIRKEQCNKVCRILDDVLANRPTERDSLIIAVRKAFESLEQLGNSEQLPSAQPEPQWIQIKWHDCTDEDREKYGFSNDIVAVFDCEMPDDDQPILVTTSHGYVNQDVCYIDDGYSLDSGWDWIDDIKAWMPLPKPWKGGEQDDS